jgi:hypothetical protein
VRIFDLRLTDSLNDQFIGWKASSVDVASLALDDSRVVAGLPTQNRFGLKVATSGFVLELKRPEQSINSQ